MKLYVFFVVFQLDFGEREAILSNGACRDSTSSMDGEESPNTIHKQSCNAGWMFTVMWTKGTGHRDGNYPDCWSWGKVQREGSRKIVLTSAQSDDVEASGNPLLVQAT